MFDSVDVISEVNLNAEMRLGDAARDILENPLIVKFFEENEKEIWQAIKSSPVRDVEGREKLLLMQKSMEKFKQYLEQTLTTGKLASLTMESRRSRLQKAKDVIGQIW